MKPSPDSSVSLPGLDIPSASKPEFSRFNNFPVDKLPEGKGGKEPTQEMIESVGRVGVLFPILVLDGEKLLVRDGLRRLKAARMAGLKEIPVVMVHGSPTCGAALGLAANALRSENPIAEVEMIKELVRAGATIEQIVSGTGLPLQRIRRIMALTNLIPALFKAVLAGEVNDKVAIRVAKLGAGEQAELHRVFKKEGKLSGAAVAAVRRVQAQSELSAIPDEAFGQAIPIDWQAQAQVKIAEAAALIPDPSLRERLLALSQQIGATSQDVAA